MPSSFSALEILLVVGIAITFLPAVAAFGAGDIPGMTLLIYSWITYWCRSPIYRLRFSGGKSLQVFPSSHLFTHLDTYFLHYRHGDVESCLLELYKNHGNLGGGPKFGGAAGFMVGVASALIQGKGQKFSSKYVIIFSWFHRASQHICPVIWNGFTL